MPEPTPVLPPQDMEAEQALLGSCMLGPNGYVDALREGIGEDSFYLEAHRLIWRAIEAAAVVAPDKVDVISVCAELRRDGKLDQCGGAEYLLALLEIPATELHAHLYARIVRERQEKRRIISEADGLMRAAYEQDVDLSGAIGRLLELRSRRGSIGAVPVGQVWDEYTSASEERRRLPKGVYGPRLGLPTFDKVYQGLAWDPLVVIKAETGFGKTTILRQSALCTAQWAQREARGKVLVYLLEDNRHEWLNGAVCFLGHLPYSWLAPGGRAEEEADGKGAVAVGQSRLGEIANALLVADNVRSIAEMRADALAHKYRQTPVVGVYVDYFQLVEAEGNSHFDRLTSVANGLLALGREIGAPVIVGSQVTAQEGGHKRARYSPELENNASTVLLLERGEGKQKNPDDARQVQVGRMIACKKRGPYVGPVEIRVRGDMARVEEVSKDWGRYNGNGPRQDY